MPGTEQPEGVRTAVSIQRKLNLGNYESVDIFVSLSNLGPETTEAEIEEALGVAGVAYEAIKADVRSKVQVIRENNEKARGGARRAS